MLSKLFTAAVALALISTVRADANCAGPEDNGAGRSRWTIRAWGVNDQPVSNVCGGLWDNLNAFSQCYGQVSGAYCGSDQTGAGADLEWQLTVPNGCDGGCLDSAWYEETKNRYGSISC